MKLTPEKLTAFCAVLAESCNVGKACKAIDISRVTAYKWRKEMPDFAAAWDEAMRIGLTALEDEAHRRAFDGVDKPIVHQGRFSELKRIKRDANGNPILGDDGEPVLEPVLDEKGEPMVASVREYSDTLAIFLLKAHAPEKYRERSSIDLTGQLSVSQMSEDEIKAELAALAASGVIPASGAFSDGGQGDDFSDLV